MNRKAERFASGENEEFDFVAEHSISEVYAKFYERKGGGNLAKELFLLQKGHCRSCSDFGIM